MLCVAYDRVLPVHTEYNQRGQYLWRVDYQNGVQSRSRRSGFVQSGVDDSRIFIGAILEMNNMA